MTAAAMHKQPPLRLPLPRSPVLGWSNFRVVDAPRLGSVERLPQRAFTTSGRAAIFHALRQAQLPPGAVVLVPSYHCPTMVAPVLLAGLQPRYFAIRPDGLPELDSLRASEPERPRAIIVSHYFGLPQSLAEVRDWCDHRGVLLIEDCAHCYFGEAGDRPVGAWGDWATASLSKFFPVPEAGLLASARRPLQPLGLRRPSATAQLKGWVDVLEKAVSHRRLDGLNGALRLLFGAKNRLRPRPAEAEGSAADMPPEAVTADGLMKDSDMGRIGDAPLAVSMWLKDALPRGRIVQRRQRNFALYAEQFADVAGARPALAFGPALKSTAPYVFPLWVDDADRVYRQVRALALPVFRWDRIWPGVPQLAGDTGPAWSRHVLQLLCHQDLTEYDVQRIVERLRDLLAPRAGT